LYFAVIVDMIGGWNSWFIRVNNHCMKYDVVSKTCLLERLIFATYICLPLFVRICGTAIANLLLYRADGAMGIGPSAQKLSRDIGSIILK